MKKIFLISFLFSGVLCANEFVQGAPNQQQNGSFDSGFTQHAEDELDSDAPVDPVDGAVIDKKEENNANGIVDTDVTHYLTNSNASQEQKDEKKEFKNRYSADSWKRPQPVTCHPVSTRVSGLPRANTKPVFVSKSENVSVNGGGRSGSFTAVPLSSATKKVLSGSSMRNLGSAATTSTISKSVRMANGGEGSIAEHCNRQINTLSSRVSTLQKQLNLSVMKFVVALRAGTAESVKLSDENDALKVEVERKNAIIKVKDEKLVESDMMIGDLRDQINRYEVMTADGNCGSECYNEMSDRVANLQQDIDRLNDQNRNLILENARLQEEKKGGEELLELKKRVETLQVELEKEATEANKYKELFDSENNDRMKEIEELALQGLNAQYGPVLMYVNTILLALCQSEDGVDLAYENMLDFYGNAILPKLKLAEVYRKSFEKCPDLLYTIESLIEECNKISLKYQK